MKAPARRATENPPAYDGYDAGEHYAHGELLPGERIGPPLASAGRKAVLRGAFLLIVLGGGWALLNEDAIWPGWRQALVAAVSSAMDRKAEPTVSAAATSIPPANSAPPKPAAIDPPPAAQSLAPGTPPVIAETTDKSTAPPLTTAALPPAADGSSEPLPPATADPADPYQMRAMAVGLHPGLSRVLLARLSEADYRNAGVAIRTALAEASDSTVFVWPRQRKPELAVFEVHFVAGAAADCRRYVVTVAKDGWLTTALPMEKCGAEVGRKRRG